MWFARFLYWLHFMPETGWFPNAILKNRSLWHQKLSNKRKTFVSSSNWISQPKWYWKEEEGIEKESWVENCLSIEKFFLFVVTILEHHLSSFPLSNSFTLLGFPNWWNNKLINWKLKILIKHMPLDRLSSFFLLWQFSNIIFVVWIWATLSHF